MACMVKACSELYSGDAAEVLACQRRVRSRPQYLSGSGAGCCVHVGPRRDLWVTVLFVALVVFVIMAIVNPQ